ncbi:MAG: tol-pal system-associated acyl-CoA thioesterase [Hyphomicrobiales bacterium]
MTERAGEIYGKVHRLAVRVYYEDTDFSGAVYHANYLKFCERGRSDCLRLLGVHHHELFDEGQGFVVRRMECDFRAPARIDDMLMVETRFIEARGARILIDQRMLRGEDRLFDAIVTVALTTSEGKPLRLPKALVEKLEPMI